MLKTGALAVDWVSDVVYFSFGDGSSSLANPNHLAIYNITSRGHTEITCISEEYAVFHDLAVDPIGR